MTLIEYLESSIGHENKDIPYLKQLSDNDCEEILTALKRPAMDEDTFNFLIKILANDDVNCCFIDNPPEGECRISNCKNCITKWLAQYIRIEVEE